MNTFNAKDGTSSNVENSGKGTRRRQRLFVAAALAVLGIGAASYGVGSRVALADSGSASPPRATRPMTPQSVQSHSATADADSGPGQCEPCVVGLQ